MLLRSNEHTFLFPWLGIICITLFQTQTARSEGGNEVGNGGNAVVCLKSAQMFDLYEAVILRNLKIDQDLSTQKTDPFLLAKGRFEILSKVDPKSAKILLSNMDKIKNDISFEDEIKIKPIGDSLHGFIPKDTNCHIEQLAVLRKHTLPQEKRILVDKSIWNKMNSLHQAALILHETIYEYISTLGEKDSTKARYLVSYMMSSEFSQVNVDAYWSLIKKLRLPIYH